MKIVVINPNSSTAMTADIAAAAKKYAGDRFEAVTVLTPGAPEFIDTFEDAARAQPGMMELVRQYVDADAFIVACACDPNLKLLRELTEKPVIGVGVASMMTAAMLGNSFSILQTDAYSVPNKKHLVEEYHMEHALASIRVAEEDSDRYSQYLKAAQKAIKEDQAEVIILGCAGLCDLAEKLSGELGVPVLDGVVCGLAMAEGIVRNHYKTSKVRYYSGGKVPVQG